MYLKDHDNDTLSTFTDVYKVNLLTLVETLFEFINQWEELLCQVITINGFIRLVKTHLNDISLLFAKPKQPMYVFSYHTNESFRIQQN